jgi:hypothetical protein
MLKARLPVRSALFKQHTGGLVVRWVTTGESPLLNVFCYCFGRNEVIFAQDVWVNMPCDQNLRHQVIWM